MNYKKKGVLIEVKLADVRNRIRIHRRSQCKECEQLISQKCSVLVSLLDEMKQLTVEQKEIELAFDKWSQGGGK